jgi:hypothetical protein
MERLKTSTASLFFASNCPVILIMLARQQLLTTDAALIFCDLKPYVKQPVALLRRVVNRTPGVAFWFF